jgi:hypothetical protein
LSLLIKKNFVSNNLFLETNLFLKKIYVPSHNAEEQFVEEITDTDLQNNPNKMEKKYRQINMKSMTYCLKLNKYVSGYFFL